MKFESGPWQPCVDTGEHSPDELKRDAAEELYAALKAVAYESDRLTPGGHDYLVQARVMEQAHAALAKAEGR